MNFGFQTLFLHFSSLLNLNSKKCKKSDYTWKYSLCEILIHSQTHKERITLLMIFVKSINTTKLEDENTWRLLKNQLKLSFFFGRLSHASSALLYSSI